MKKFYAKLIMIALHLTLAISVVAMSSYAWMVLSNNPVAEGIQITIGGGNTILVAPDLTQESGGSVYHYPGVFKDTLNFSQSTSYAYLGNLSNLTPVSTADGLNWFLPAYYDFMDEEVQDGQVLSGTLKPVDEFILDDSLSHANLSSDDTKLASQGSYLYLDFWVVSPGADYVLRVSTGEDSGGSYVIGLPQAQKTGSGYALSSDENNAEACVRVGLLANPDYVTDDTMWHYLNSSGYSSQYSKLRGSYMEPNGSYVYSSDYRFTIYEPNGDVHPTNSEANGSYLFTKPIGLVDGLTSLVDVTDNLTVQLKSGWAEAQIGEGTQLEQRFQAAVLEPSFKNLSTEEVTQKFYEEYLGAQVSPYVSKGLFIKNTQNLYSAAAQSGIAGTDYLGSEYTAGATDDVYIVKLEKNVPQHIRMFIWLEGQDEDCINSASASSFAFRIELAGSQEETGEDVAAEVVEDIEAISNDTEIDPGTVSEDTEVETITSSEDNTENAVEPEVENNNSNSTEIQLEE